MTEGYPPFDSPKPVAEGVWIVDAAPMQIMGIRMPVRMTVIRLQDGALWLHSPTRMTLALREELERLGPIRHLVAPNSAHWTFLQGWQERVPDATVWAAPELWKRGPVKRSGLRLDRELEETPPADWAEQIDQTVVPGTLGFREMGFFHRASRTLVLTDLIASIEPQDTPTRIYAQLAGVMHPQASTPRHVRPLLLVQGTDARRAMRRMVEWQPERVIFAHGRWFEADGANRMRGAFRWLLG